MNSSIDQIESPIFSRFCGTSNVIQLVLTILYLRGTSQQLLVNQGEQVYECSNAAALHHKIKYGHRDQIIQMVPIKLNGANWNMEINLDRGEKSLAPTSRSRGSYGGSKHVTTINFFWCGNATDLFCQGILQSIFLFMRCSIVVESFPVSAISSTYRFANCNKLARDPKNFFNFWRYSPIWQHVNLYIMCVSFSNFQCNY